MADLSYRCPVDPDGCLATEESSFCATHFVPYEYRPPQRPSAPAEARPTPAPRLMALRFQEALLMIGSDGLRIGRDYDDCAAVPGLARLTQLSRRHAEIFWSGDTLRIRDIDSTNGTFVNGADIRSRPQAEAPLPFDAELRFGLDLPVDLLELDEYGFSRSDT